ncbi:ABC transporter permease [Campylobacter sp. CCS1377]|uniref:ABC transporter permease n=1 Tax=Campylobacter sp. CCS1377 TaxID=3158229 RepID=A0AAU7E8B8_9BACT|nr:ABC transporter permease [Campylobacter jejuni]
MSANFKFQKQEQNDELMVFGIWDKNSIANLNPKDILSQISKQNLILNFENLEDIDMAGVCFFLALEHDLKLQNINTQKSNLRPQFQSLFELCEKNYTRFVPLKKDKLVWSDFFYRLGNFCIQNLKTFQKFIAFSGMVFYTLFYSLFQPKKIRFISFLYHIEYSAFRALPIVALTSLLVGVVLAYQAAYQLEQFGANIFIVDLTGISATREIAPLIAAIVIAGRSASSYTAQIGVMKITDEIDAMNTMGFKSSEFIILPRILALVVAMPLVVALADAVSILGGMIIADLNLDINYNEFMRRFKEAVELKHIIIGLIKAPIFGFLIGIIACFRGFEVKNTTESIGIYTTKSVVNAIFWVIAFDALFSVVLTQMGI